MNISEHKRLVANIPEDLIEGEEIEVSDDGERWERRFFVSYFNDHRVQSFLPSEGFPRNSIASKYARRHVASTQNKEKS